MSKLHADYYADSMHQVESPLVRNEKIAEDTFLLRVDAPEIASQVVPGQFVMIRLSHTDAPLIGRALAVYDVINEESGKPKWIDLVYLRKGAMTSALASLPLQTKVTVWGPLGNGFANRECDHLIMVAGGIGQTPMLLLGREALGSQIFGSPNRKNGWSDQVTLIYGARRKGLLAGVSDFTDAGFDVHLCTDDGSEGEQKLVPEVLAEKLSAMASEVRVRVVTCGPEIMMEKVAEICESANVDCQVSMETPMACGIGICFSCVAKVKQDGPEQWDYKRTCVEGPIFDSEKICW
ncbi:dihydroorotate dehydrogenase electron transfer subunit [Rhodopirellula sp.]|nr:dihydroorotate dehydrogenase electron transfer subunit [Rhodopirellula sp.]